MKCNEVRTFFSQVSAKSITAQIQQTDLDFLSTAGYLSVMQKEEYDKAVAEVANLTQLNEELQSEATEERSAAVALEKDERKTHSILFHFEGREKREAELERVESERNIVSKDEAVVAESGSKVNELIQKKSVVDRMVSYDGRYMALTGPGVIALNDLNVRNYRVSDNEFSDFIEESKATSDELRSIAARGGFYVSTLKAEFPETDLSQVWSVSIGLAKLQGDQNQISHRFLLAVAILLHLKSTVENKMMAAEIITSSKADPSQSSTNSDLQSLSESLVSLDSELRRRANVPKQLSAGVAATIMAGRKFDGTYPTDRFVEFSKTTSSYESAAILSTVNVSSDQLAGKFKSFRELFESWGYEASEDTELASAYLAISDLGPADIHTKMTIILDALKNYLAYPLVAAAILVSIPTLEANETLNLMEKAYSLLAPLATGLERSELVSLSVRMVHGIRNELVKELDSTATITKTPVQFTYGHSGFFPLYFPLIIAYSSYYSTFSGMGGAHPAHVHGVGGFMG
jgi:hypothetical protein